MESSDEQLDEEKESLSGVTCLVAMLRLHGISTDIVTILSPDEKRRVQALGVALREAYGRS